MNDRLRPIPRNGKIAMAVLAEQNLAAKAATLEKTWIGWAIEGSALVFFLTLMYKQAAVGILCLLVLSALLPMVPLRWHTLRSPLALFTIGYVFMSTVTAFMLGMNNGVFRTLQFISLTGAALTLTNYLWTVSAERRQRFFRLFAYTVVAVFAHLVLWHLANGMTTTWKYLSDTKTTISLVILVVFIYEGPIRRRAGGLTWLAVLALLAVLVLLSGERKAYVLLGVVFLLSTVPVQYKAATIGIAVGAISMLVSASEPGDYVARQIDSLFNEAPKLTLEEIYQIPNLGDFSDLSRQFTNSQARRMFMENPILGLGANGYWEWAKAEFGSVRESGGRSMNVHGEINRVPAEGGIVGITFAVGYGLLLAAAVYRHLVRRGGLRTDSMQRAPLYIFMFVVLFASVEAMDTAMLTMFLSVGLIVAAMDRSPVPAEAAVLAHRPRSKRQVRLPRPGLGRRTDSALS